MSTASRSGRVEELALRREPFVSATVVHAERPTSASPGDAALVLADGTIEGFVGGACAESSVRVQALDCLVDGRPVLLRITPDAEGDASPDPIGRVTVSNPCLSGGTIEVFLQPVIPAPLLVVVGSGPIALALEQLGPSVGFDVRRGDDFDATASGTEAVVIASHGRGEEDALHRALDAEIPYIGLVASQVRRRAVLDGLGRCSGQTSKVSTPAGLDIGARTPAEVALSIIAEIVAARPRIVAGDDPAAANPAAPTAVDPVCAMPVAMVSSSLCLDHEAATYWFCGRGCRDAFAAAPSGYL